MVFIIYFNIVIYTKTLFKLLLQKFKNNDEKQENHIVFNVFFHYFDQYFGFLMVF